VERLLGVAGVEVVRIKAVYAELLKDVTIRLPPLTDLDAREMISSIKMAKLFEGFRGSPPSDTKALEDLLPA